MKITHSRWYSITLVICLMLFLIMVYRREARMRAHIEKLETRIESLEQYIRGANAISCEHAKMEETGPKGNTPKKAELPVKRSSMASIPQATGKPASQVIATEEERRDGKFKQVVRLELNTIDSLTLVRVPGIGEGTAHTILQYRERLGGFYSVDQLRERLTWESAQTHLDEWCEQWFWVDENLIQMLHINKLQFKELLKHPYLDYEDVKAITKWRDRHKSIQKEAELRQLWSSDSTKLEKLLHYVAF